MKMSLRFFTLFLALTTVTLFSCKEDLAEQNRAKMVGTWMASSYSQTNCDDNADNADLVFGDEGACFDVVVGQSCVTVEFTFEEDGTYRADFNTIISSFGVEISNQTESVNGTWEVNSATEMTVCTTDEDGVTSCSKGTYVVTNNSLTFNGSNDENGCDTRFTATK